MSGFLGILAPNWRQTVIWTYTNSKTPLAHLPSEQNGCHFPDDLFISIFVNENVCILIKMSLKFVPDGLINNKPALVQIMAWRRIGDKPLSEPMLTQYTDAYMRHYGEISWASYTTVPPGCHTMLWRSVDVLLLLMCWDVWSNALNTIA